MKEIALTQEALGRLSLAQKEWLRVFYGKTNHEWIANKLKLILETSGADKSEAIIGLHHAMEIEIEQSIENYLSATTVFNKTVQKFLTANWKKIGLKDSLISAYILQVSGDSSGALTILNYIKGCVPQAAFEQNIENRDELSFKLDVKILDIIVKLGASPSKAQGVTAVREDTVEIKAMVKRLGISKNDILDRLDKLLKGDGFKTRQMVLGTKRLIAILGSVLEKDQKK